MSVTYITIKEAAELSGKSPQTIRRAIKANKIESKKKKTAQGYNYMIVRESVIKTYKLRMTEPVSARKSTGLSAKKPKQMDLMDEYASIGELKALNKKIEEIIDENEQMKKSLMGLIKTFQDQYAVLENRMHLIEAPKDKKWYQFWK
ncbi:hypothetical protein GF340_03470 [Candidatus Peregrinibacteria bacterium]|nr:hypothetical protein [Candidatus Peregrinibacteria bacterium]